MKKRFITKLLALLICAALLATCFPLSAFAEAVGTAVEMVEGDVIKEFAPAGAICVSTDPSVAWVDENGSLNALKVGAATVTVTGEDESQTDYAVTVEDYSDGSETVGNLKILARYNDSMQFYDGHVYLLFTSYQDGVEITVDDLYGGYEISDRYYDDIREDISNGSNHTGTDAKKYFTYDDEMTSVTVDRGEIVTIGMYRGFDLTVPQAALGSLQNSSFWTELVNTGKASVIENLFGLLEYGKISTDEAVEKIKAIFDELGIDYNKALDGVVEGGVCFNRELYNQKLEWDQFENVTYELDITRNQLDMMQAYLGGNLNKFSILKNSCATVALRAWNAAVGTRNGEDTAYKLSSAGDGIFSIIDAPKGVRDNIVSRLPGYYLNNSEGVAEPDAGYQADTGWVYVSAPEVVAPVEYTYENNSVFVEGGQNALTSLINIAKAGQDISYKKDGQDVDVDIPIDVQGDLSTISNIDFHLNGKVVSVNADNAPEDGIWFSVKVNDPAEGAIYYAEDAEGNALASDYAYGRVSFFAESLPVTYKIVDSSEGAKNILRTTYINGDMVKSDTTVYLKNGDEKVVLGSSAELNAGDKIYIAPKMDEDEWDYIVSDIAFNGESIYNEENYDADESAYFAVMPENYSQLTITYSAAWVDTTADFFMQIAVGDTLAAADYAELLIGNGDTAPDKLMWKIIYDSGDGTVENDGKTLTGARIGSVIAWVYAESNENKGRSYYIEVYDSLDDCYAVTFDEEYPEYDVTYTLPGDDNEYAVLTNGYLVKKGAELTVVPSQIDSKAVAGIICNDTLVGVGEKYTVESDTKISVIFADAKVKGMPKSIELASKGDTYQLEAKVAYTGLYKLLPVYDSSIKYVSSDPMVTVDEDGLITVAGDIPEEGKAVYVTAYAGSSNNNVFAQTKVVLGDYQGDKIVGKLTVSARKIVQAELVAHSELVFTAYDDMDIPVSFYDYYKPNDKYNELMLDYEEHPENYTSDPALYNENELGLENRESYFDAIVNGSNSEPYTISMKAGESFSISDYSYDRSHLTLVRKALEGSVNSYDAARRLAEQMKLYEQGQEIDAVSSFDDLVRTLAYSFVHIYVTGKNPADGQAVGGNAVNREVYNQFRRNDSQLPNNYYTVEITADELAQMQSYLANPDNNYYSLFTKNCTTGVVDLWNTTLFDKPELHLSGNNTGIGSDPEELYFEIGALRLKPCLEGEGGVDYYPRISAYSDAVADVIDKIDAIGEVALTDECKAAIDAAREAYDALNDVQKDRVRNADVLTDAENKYNELKTEADLAAFDEYKEETKAAADALAQEGDSEATKLIIEIAKKIVDATPFDSDKTLDENKAALDDIISKLSETVENQRAYEADLAAFDEYKEDMKAAADALAQEGDSEATKLIIEIAKKIVDATPFDADKTLDENKAALDNIISKLSETVEDQRTYEADLAAFDEYKEDTKAAADALAQEGDSEAVMKMIEIAKKAIDAIPYDDSKSLEENKANVGTVIDVLEITLNETRYYEHPFLGDVDGDKEVTVVDATFIQRKVVHLPVPILIFDAVADADGDGEVTITDATYIQRWLVRLPSNDNIGKPIASY